MLNLNSNQVDQLLELIKNREDQKIVKQHLQDLQKSDSEQSDGQNDKKQKKTTAKKALSIISRIGLEMGKHKLIEWFFDGLD